MKKPQLSELAKQYFILDDGLSETNLIRRIQRAEGSLDCYATTRVWICVQFGCNWRRDCLRQAAESAPVELP